jgi:starch synthase
VNVLHAASEIYPLASTGGLSSVVRGLPLALGRRSGVNTAVVVPFYSQIANSCQPEWLETRVTFMGEEFGLGRLECQGLPVFLVARDECFARDGIYGPVSGESWNDNAERFAFFSRAVASLGRIGDFYPDVIHCHDWQTALVPVYLREGDMATVLTIHNLAFQGRFPAGLYAEAGLPYSLYSVDGLEFFGDWNMLKGGIIWADMLTTVSPSYAEEILTPEFGCSLDGVLREHSGKLVGILNGIDTDLWDPAGDPVIRASYSASSVSGKAICRKALIEECGLDGGFSGPLLGIVSRLTEQKGIDLTAQLLSHMIDAGCGLVILGTGEPDMESALVKASKQYSGRVSVVLEYNDDLARKIFAGCDGFLMPSRFEPCGLGQMMAMRYGSVPLVRSVGGLRDTVKPEFGFSFYGEGDQFLRAFRNLMETWSDRRRWAWYRRRCMVQNFSWEGRTDEYMRVYTRAMEKRGL